MLIVTTPEVPGYQIRMVFGPVMGRSVYVSTGIASLTSNRAKAFQDLHHDAARYGANAVVSIRFDAPSDGLDWVVGTAVWVDPVSEDARAQYAAMVAARRVPSQAPPAGTLPAYFGPPV
ncbi:hypothetical protein GCM10009765_29460 [Fodinicola feengrottensis]|uniref:Uncharacterized protein n=1 Tax=Fodinicola feengrottensis TaxID=435914 RepID=A0ABN2GX15_9ACTN